MRIAAWMGLGVALLAGCAGAPPSDSDISADDDAALSTSELRERSHIQTTLAREGTTELDYDPGRPSYKGIPYEGAELGFAGGSLSIEVAGEFPSTARVLVVDQDFHVLARAKTERGSGVKVQTNGAASLGVAKLAVANAPINGKILVRDAKWDRAMTFRVDVRRN